MNDRLTPQREAEYRALVERTTPLGAATASPGALAEVLAELTAVRAERDQAQAAVQRGLDTLRVWRDERQTGPEAARLLYEVGAALTDETQPAKYALVPRWEYELMQRQQERAVAAEARVAELEKAAEQIRHLHKDSPMGPCPVCVDGDAMARGDDPTVPYPCPTARLAGAKDCDPPSFHGEWTKAPR